MKKLDDIPRKHPFNVPDDYFDELPGKVHARIHGASRERSPAFRYTVRIALAAITIAVVAFVWIWKSPAKPDNQSPETILASLETSELIAWLEEGDVPTDELLDEIQLDNEDAYQIEGAVFNLDLDDSDIDNLINEID